MLPKSKTWKRRITIEEANVLYDEFNLMLSHYSFANYYVPKHETEYFEYEGRLGYGVVILQHDYTHHAAIISYYLRRN